MEKRKWERIRNRKELGCKFIRINPDAENYDIFVEIGEIRNNLIKTTKKQAEVSTKKSRNNDLFKRLLELEFKSNYSIKLKCLKSIF